LVDGLPATLTSAPFALEAAVPSAERRSNQLSDERCGSGHSLSAATSRETVWASDEFAGMNSDWTRSSRSRVMLSCMQAKCDSHFMPGGTLKRAAPRVPAPRIDGASLRSLRPWSAAADAALQPETNRSFAVAQQPCTHKHQARGTYTLAYIRLLRSLVEQGKSLPKPATCANKLVPTGTLGVGALVLHREQVRLDLVVHRTKGKCYAGAMLANRHR
jgi:hypothetical protein